MDIKVGDRVNYTVSDARIWQNCVVLEKLPDESVRVQTTQHQGSKLIIGIFLPGQYIKAEPDSYLYFYKNQTPYGRAMVYNREKAQKLLEANPEWADTYTIYKLVPVSLVEETITTTKKVIP